MSIGDARNHHRTSAQEAITLELPRIKFVLELQKAQRYSHSATVYPSISETELAVLSEC